MTQRLDNETAILTIAEVAEFDYDYLEGFNYNALPAGWKFLGNGVSRWAFLAPDGWVYKFGARYANDVEVENSRRLYLEQDDTFRVPWVEHCGSYGHWTVVRCEYIMGQWLTEHDYYTHDDDDDFIIRPEWQGIHDHLRRYRLGDLHYENVCFVDGGVPAVIDLGW